MQLAALALRNEEKDKEKNREICIHIDDGGTKITITATAKNLDAGGYSDRNGKLLLL